MMPRRVAEAQPLIQDASRRSLPFGTRLRQLGAASLLVIGACTYEQADHSEGPAGSSAPAATQLTAGTTSRDIRLLADGVRKPGGEASLTGSTLLIPGYPGSALLAFEAADTPSECLASATLSADHLTGDAVPIAWVSLETDLPALADGQSLGGQVIAGRSPSVAPVLANGRYIWDVTELWAWSLQHQPAASAFVVVLKPEFVEASEPVQLGASEGTSGAELTVEERLDCP